MKENVSRSHPGLILRWNDDPPRAKDGQRRRFYSVWSGIEVRAGGKHGVTPCCSGLHPEIVGAQGQVAKCGAIVHEVCSRGICSVRDDPIAGKPRSHRFCVVLDIANDTKPVGAWLAREGARTVTENFSPAGTSPSPAARFAPGSGPPYASPGTTNAHRDPSRSRSGRHKTGP